MCTPEIHDCFLDFRGVGTLWYALGDILMGQDPQDSSRPAPKSPSSDLDAVADMVQDVLEEKRSNPGDDHLSWLVQQEAEGLLFREEWPLFANCLAFAGVDTTVNLLGNGTGLPGRYPDQRAKLYQLAGRLDGAIEEMLRMCAPAQGLPRRLTRDLTLHGTTIPRAKRSA
ncbi:MAG: hypothetical protein R3E50_09535 [Halioglobus sp.]